MARHDNYNSSVHCYCYIIILLKDLHMSIRHYNETFVSNLELYFTIRFLHYRNLFQESHFNGINKLEWIRNHIHIEEDLYLISKSSNKYSSLNSLYNNI